MPLEFDANGKPIRRKVGRPREARPQARRTQFNLHEKVRIVGLMPGITFTGVIVSLDPVTARVIDDDLVWKGAETTHGLRKMPQENES